ncbi:hypothetical protein BH23VER1_BH23VER1_19950 [soil metagenome]
MDLADELERRLPPRRPITYVDEPDYYGASRLISGALGLPDAPKTLATWMHGWRHFPVWREPWFDDPALLVAHLFYNAEPWWAHLTATAEQAEALAAVGLTTAVPVGLPFIYTEEPGFERIPGSLLVCPPHALPHTVHQFKEDDYLADIEPLREAFPHLVFCLTAYCVTQGLWVDKLRERGIPFVVGAEISDGTALQRMRNLFSSFEAMTTGQMGSHVPYAAFCGCRVSIYGAGTELEESVFAKDPFYQAHPRFLEETVRFSQRASIARHFPDLCVPPTESTRHVRWAQENLGLAHRRPPEEIARLFGWAWSPENALWIDSAFSQIAPVLGWHPPAPASEPAPAGPSAGECRLRRQNAALQEKLDVLTGKHAIAQAQLTQLQRSPVWPLAKLVFSFHKRRSPKR